MPNPNHNPNPKKIKTMGMHKPWHKRHIFKSTKKHMKIMLDTFLRIL